MSWRPTVTLQIQPETRPPTDGMNQQLLFLLACLGPALGAKILAFLPLPARSHHISFHPLLRELANRGHQVDYFTAVPLPDPPKNLRHIKIKDYLADLHGKMDIRAMMTMPIPTSSMFISEMSLYMFNRMFKEEPEWSKLLTSTENYDVVLLELHFAQEWAAALCHRFNSTCVALAPLSDSVWADELAGLPQNPSYQIDMKAKTTDKLTFVERLYNCYIWLSTVSISYYYAAVKMQALADNHVTYPGWESRPSVVEMSKDMDLVLLNGHHSLSYPFPKAPHVKEVGGMHVAPAKPLPKDLQELMDSANQGVIFFSYGTNVDVYELTKDGKLDAFVNAFKKLKQKVLWKWKGSEIPKIDAPNVKMQQWFPQNDILAHKNTKLFITHGGLMSTIEAIHHGVPLVGTAVFGDQPKNLRFVEDNGLGIHLPYDNITEASLGWAIGEVLGNPNYKENMKKRSELFKDRPMKPVDEAAYWIEYVIKHGKVLQPASVRMPFYQVYLLDLMAAAAAAVVITLWLVKKLSRALCSLCSGNKNNTVGSKKKRL